MFMPQPTAMLVLVTGPTGAGKDTLIAAARRHMAAEPRFRFVRRVVARAPEIDGCEDFESVDEAGFLRRRDAGLFAVWWRSGGVLFGIPADIALDLQAGHVVVANVARTALPELAGRFPLHVIEITAPADQLARRLAAKGRDDAVDAARRLARHGAVPAGVTHELLANDGSIEHGVRKIVAALHRVATPGQRIGATGG